MSARELFLMQDRNQKIRILLDSKEPEIVLKQMASITDSISLIEDVDEVLELLDKLFKSHTSTLKYMALFSDFDIEHVLAYLARWFTLCKDSGQLMYWFKFASKITRSTFDLLQVTNLIPLDSCRTFDECNALLSLFASVLEDQLVDLETDEAEAQKHANSLAQYVHYEKCN